FPAFEQLPAEQRDLPKIEQGVQISDMLRCEYVRIGAKCGANRKGGCARRWASIGAGAFFERACQHVELRKKDGVQRFLGVVLENEVVHVRNGHFGRIARIDGAPSRAFAIQLVAGYAGPDDIPRIDSKALEISREEWRV